MRVPARMLAVIVCLSFVALLGACGAKPSGTASPTSSPSITLTSKQRATAYCKALVPVFKEDRALWGKFKRFQTIVGTDTNAFSLAARINGSYLPAVEQMQARVAAITPPAGFRVAHGRLKKILAIENNVLYFVQDSLQRATYTQSFDLAAYRAQGDRYIARLKVACRQWVVALRAAVKRAGVTDTPRPLRQTLV